MWNYPGMGEMGIMVLLWIIPILVIGLVVWLVVRAASGRPGSSSSESAEDLLRRRFASGEIDIDEYQRRLEVLRHR
jgi:uncharacterized membrane protein